MTTIRPPDFITFTGADDQTPIDGLQSLSSRYPIEWGILLDPDKQGLDPRFPSRGALEALAATDLRLAAHLCGGHTIDVRAGRPVRAPIDLRRFERIQVNSHEATPEQAVRISQTLGRRCILPCKGAAFPEDEAVDWLHDLSGGRGRETRRWPRHPGRLAGYAGGIGPETVETVLATIDADGAYWIDMETKVRSHERFDLDLCELVCLAVYGERSSR